MARTKTAATYSALVRTFNSERTLGATLRSLSMQAYQPEALVVVDSGSVDGTLARIPSGSKLHRYVGSAYNYSAALNQGLQHVDSDYVLIISSHTVLENPNAVAYAIGILESEPMLGAAYFDFSFGPLGHSVIDAHYFDGFNGLWNTCSLIRVALLRSRPFREEIPAAEDQEWAAWLIRSKSMATARISGGGMQNPFNTPPRSPSHVRKVIKEQAAVRHFILNESPLELLSTAMRPGSQYSWRHRALQSVVALRVAWLKRPSRQ